MAGNYIQAAQMTEIIIARHKQGTIRKMAERFDLEKKQIKQFVECYLFA